MKNCSVLAPPTVPQHLTLASRLSIRCFASPSLCSWAAKRHLWQVHLGPLGCSQNATTSRPRPTPFATNTLCHLHFYIIQLSVHPVQTHSTAWNRSLLCTYRCIYTSIHLCFQALPGGGNSWEVGGHCCRILGLLELPTPGPSQQVPLRVFLKEPQRARVSPK